MQFFGGKGQIFPVLGAQGTGAECLTVDAGLGRKDAVRELFLGHFQAENGHRHLLLHGHAGSDVQRETGLAHTGAGSEDDEVAAAKAGEHRIQQAEACGDALVFVRIRAADLLQVGQGLHHAGGKRCQCAGIAAGADLINALLRVFKQQVGIRLISGILQDVLCNTHQLAHQILFLHDLGIGLHVGNAGHRLGKAGQVHLCFVGTGEHTVRDNSVQQRHKVDGLVGGEQAQHFGVDLRILPGVEHLRPDDLHQVGERFRFEQHRTQHALLCLHVVGQVDAHAFQIQFIGIMSFVRHGSLSFCIISLKSQKAPPAVRGRRWQKNQACSTSTMILKEATTPTCRRTLPLNTPASLMSLVSSSIFFLSMGAPAS